MIFNIHLKIDENKLSTIDISNTEDESETWFWNKSANKSNLDIKKREKDDKNELDLEIDKSRTVSLKDLEKEMK